MATTTAVSLPFINNILDGSLEIREVRGLHDVGVGNPYREIIPVVIGSEHDNRHTGFLLFQIPQNLDAVHVRHKYVQGDEVRTLPVKDLEGLPSGIGCHYLVPLVLELCLIELQYVLLVVNHEDSHATPPL